MKGKVKKANPFSFASLSYQNFFYDFIKAEAGRIINPKEPSGERYNPVLGLKKRERIGGGKYEESYRL